MQEGIAIDNESENAFSEAKNAVEIAIAGISFAVTKRRLGAFSGATKYRKNIEIKFKKFKIR